MTIKFSEDLVPLTDLKVNPGRVVKHMTEAHRPVLLTSRRRYERVFRQGAPEFIDELFDQSSPRPVSRIDEAVLVGNRRLEGARNHPAAQGLRCTDGFDDRNPEAFAHEGAGRLRELGVHPRQA